MDIEIAPACRDRRGKLLLMTLSHKVTLEQCLRDALTSFFVHPTSESIHETVLSKLCLCDYCSIVKVIIDDISTTSNGQLLIALSIQLPYNDFAKTQFILNNKLQVIDVFEQSVLSNENHPVGLAPPEPMKGMSHSCISLPFFEGLATTLINPAVSDAATVQSTQTHALSKFNT